VLPWGFAYAVRIYLANRLCPQESRLVHYWNVYTRNPWLQGCRHSWSINTRAQCLGGGRLPLCRYVCVIIEYQGRNYGGIDIAGILIPGPSGWEEGGSRCAAMCA